MVKTSMLLSYRKISFFVLFCCVFWSILFSLSKGSVAVPWSQLFSSENQIFLQLRLPRTVCAFVSGGSLALAGALMQLLLQNPLADPYVLGVSSGAALVSLLGMILGLSQVYVLGGAWAGSLVTIMLILFLTRKQGFQPQQLLLSGIALATGFSAAISFILLISPNSHLHSMLFWLSGDLNDAEFPWLALGIFLLSFVICLLLAPGLNIFVRGENAARALGLASDKYRLALFLISSLLTATAVSLAGCVGFIGLIVPHITRLLFGYDQRRLLPYSALLGGCLLTIADTCARSLFSPQQIPVGILLALLGVPMFIWLIQHERTAH